ncbi:MAG: Gfo/Idh/MocA family oxidoreductase [Candidatus Goldbacteria bacterium]|nr:Gfo/Idh/MocA family oxidoreductase [Candidatus Goldiibacteriota bacterium]
MKKIKVGIIGAGKIAERLHLPQYSELKNVEITAICDIIRKKAERLAKIYKISKIYTDYKKMIKDAGIDAVSVCTPNYLHAPMTIFAANNKKHVLVEKPMAISVAEMKQMISTCERNNVILMVEQTQRFDPAHEILKEVVESGILGKIATVRGKLGHSGPEFWSDDSPWFFDKKKSGGGVSVDVGIHILDLIRFVLGNAEIESVSAKIANLIKKKIKLEDTINAIIKFKNGIMGTFEASWSTSPYEVRVEVCGSHGKAIVQQANADPQRLRVWTIDPKNPYNTIKEHKYKIPKESKFKSPCAHFINCIIKKQKPIIDGVEGMKSMAVILAALKSAKTGRVEKVNI